MEAITGNAFTHLNIKRGEKNSQKVISVAEDDGLVVQNYTEMARHVSEIGYRNPKFQLLFRGQSEDYKIEHLSPGKSRTQRRLISSILPKIYRNLNSNVATLNTMRDRIDILLDKSSWLINLPPFQRDSRLRQNIEMCWAVLQHYEKADTPLVDLSQSLHIAASFALMKNNSGYVYVFGVPPLQGSISHFVDDSISIIRLQAACPPPATRPHLQEGFLVGHFPFQSSLDPRNFKVSHVSSTLNLSRRMLGKFKISNLGKFWDGGFTKIEKLRLLPENDPLLDELSHRY
jgi:hypothetical protein